MTIVSAVSLIVGDSSVTPTARTRSNFAVHHLRAAAQAAREAHEVEQANPPEYGVWFHDMLRLVPVSIVMAAAALEANANEIVQDILDIPEPRRDVFQITNGRRRLVQDLKKDRAGESMEKYRRLALLFDKDPDTGNAVWEAADRLVQFRNRFMHFRPAWTDQTDVHQGDLSKWLHEMKIPIAPGDQPPNSFRFPDGFMTYGCARWSVQTVLAFSKKYAPILGIRDDPFAARPADYDLP